MQLCLFANRLRHYAHTSPFTIWQQVLKKCVLLSPNICFILSKYLIVSKRSLTPIAMCFLIVFIISPYTNLNFPSTSAGLTTTSNAWNRNLDNSVPLVGTQSNGPIKIVQGNVSVTQTYCIDQGNQFTNTPQGRILGEVYECDQPILNQVANTSLLSAPVTGNVNDLFYWSSGSCSSDCAYTATSISTAISPNTPY